MAQLPPPTESQREVRDLSLDLFSLIERITESDIDDLRARIRPELRKSFDAEEEDGRLVLTALFRMGYENLVKFRSKDKNVYVVGLHDIRGRLTFLFHAVPEIEERWQQEK